MKTIKNKITTGFIYLFGIILVLSVLGIVFINQLADKSKGTIKENYHSVDYTFKMMETFEKMHFYYNSVLLKKGKTGQSYIAGNSDMREFFEINLKKETNNITEPGEGELVYKLHNAYNNYINLYEKLNAAGSISEEEKNDFHQKYLEVKQIIEKIYFLNMEAVSKKINSLQKTADTVILYMTIVAIISILITLSFVIKFPKSIVDPIKQLTQKIKFISERNYNQKLEIKNQDELGDLALAFNVMAEKLKTYEEKQIDQLLFEQKRLVAVVQSIEDGVIFMDVNRKIVLVNNTICQITGLNENNLLKKSLADLADSNDLINELNKSVNRKKQGSNELIPLRITLDNKEFFFNVETEEIITFAHSEQKETFIGNLILLKNITKFQERDKAKTNLLATVSHELKTPLSSINLSLKLLDDKRFGELNSEQKEVVSSLKQQSIRLSRVINELLDYSQIETGNIRLTFSNVKPEVILDIGITAMMMQLSQKNIDLQTYIEDNLPEIYVDFEKLAFVFINILNNAIRYSQDGGIIKTTVQRNNNDVEFSISDNGPGITEEDMDKIFQRFTQVGIRSKQGWGLGLAISKEFVQAQGGNIRVESEINRGSKFIFTIPIEK